MSARRSVRVARSRRRAREDARRGVLLLIVMALLALLTLLGLTLVVATSQGRMSALAASRSSSETIRDDALVDEVLNQVLRGTNDSDSVLQGHGLLDDLYGPPQLFGRVASPSSPTALDVIPLANGQLLTMNILPAKGYALAPYNGAYCGQVITMIDGPAQGYSSRIVGYVYYPGPNPFATIQVLSFSGLVPNAANPPSYLGDQFLINGRPFSGTGFGFNLANVVAPGGLNLSTPVPTAKAAPYDVGAMTTTGPLLNAVELSPTPANTNKPAATGMPYAFLPNHAQIQLTPKSNQQPPYYYDPTGPGGANEAYDAVDFQNMLLAMHIQYLAGNAITPIPSLHRPELVAWYAQQAVANSNPAINMSGAGYPNNLMRRKVVLRPEPMDQVFVPATQDLNGNGVWDFREPFVDLDGSQTYTGGEPFLDLNADGTWTTGDLDYSGNQFNPITGCWYIDGSLTPPVWKRDPFVIGGLDVDNDNDGIPDSIWVDAGLPVQTAANGTQYKWLAAILCIDMDGKINLNAHGSIAQLDPNRYSATSPTSTVSGPLAGTTGQALIEASPHSRNFPIGQGYGPADINPAYVLARAYPGALGTVNNNVLNYYTYLTMGYAYFNYLVNPPYFVYSVDGKYGESARIYQNSVYLGLYPPADDNSPYPVPAVTSPGYTFQQYLLGGPRPGWSRWIDPWMTDLTWTNPFLNPSLSVSTGVGWDWVNDPIPLARLSDTRPFLLNPQLQLLPVSSPPYPAPSYLAPSYFDFIGQNLIPNDLVAPYANPSLHVPTAHGSPYDLHGRGVVATDLRGAPYYGGTAVLPWMTNLKDPALYTPPSGPPNPNLTRAYLSYLNDAVDSPYELDLTANAQHNGRNSGNMSGAASAPTDSPITAAEFEGVLRVNDSDSADLRKRLDQLETIALANSYSPPAPPPLPPEPTTTSLANMRLSLTSESWDLPVAGVALTPLQMQDVAAFNANPVMLGAGTQLNLSGLSLTDLARARIFVENPGSPAFTTPNAADLALFGNVNTFVQPFTNGITPVWPLLSSEVIMGMRLDINRLLGNGQDDNGNGVVDEPLEAFWLDSSGTPHAEQMTFPWSPTLPMATGVQNPATLMNNIVELLDLNNDGFFPTNVSSPITSVLKDPQTSALVPLSDPTMADTRARQLLARHLYVTMMLLLDDRMIGASIFTQPPLSSLTPQEQAAYVVAQWAINVVDFRDRDSIMTPFEFDLHPFVANDTSNPLATWNVDDIVGTADDTSAWRGIVWGCEQPGLLITEAVAFHDRGTDDTSQAQNLASGPDTLVGVPNGDKDYDQVRRPRGSLIVELFNTTSWANPPQRDLQYDQNLTTQPWQSTASFQSWMNTIAPGASQGYGINLAQVANRPAGSTALPLSSPVWRLAILYSPLGYDSYTTAPNSATYTLDPRVPVLPPLSSTAPTPTTTKINRAVYFTPYNVNFRLSAGVINEVYERQSFFADASVVPNSSFLMVPPGQYAVVGPASPITTGPNSLPATNPTATFANAVFIGQNYVGQTTRQSASNSNAEQFELGGANGWTGPVGMYNGVTPSPIYVPGNFNIKPVIGVPIQTNWLDASYNYLAHLSANSSPPTPSGVAWTLRMSVSEPQYGYPVFNSSAVADDGFYYSTQGTPSGAQFPQNPYDSPANQQMQTAQNYPNPYVADGTTSGYTIVCLQRLANPLIPWNGVTNPYITVDSMPVDLTGYTGENHPLDPMSTTPAEPAYSNAPMTIGAFAFDTRRRGGTATNGQATEAPNIWAPVAWPPFVLPTAGTLAAPLPHGTLGYLNTYEYGPAYTASTPGNLATISASTGIPAAQYYGDPVTPFPWLTWLDRPYVSQNELMLVPASSPSSFASDFSMFGWQSGYSGTSVPQYQPGAPAAGKLPIAQFGHLLNFFNTQQSTPGTYLSNLYRVFEHVQVPSRFAGTQTMLSPYLFESNYAGAVPHFFHPPFNWVSSYREPGRININTIFDNQVFEGLMDAYPGWAVNPLSTVPGGLWQQVIDSRQGHNGVGNSLVPNWNAIWNPNGAGQPQNEVYPTFFANPFRPDGAGALVPQASMTTSVTPPTSPYAMMHPWNYPTATANVYDGVSATMLRANNAYSDPGSTESATIATATGSLFDDINFDTNNLTATYSYASNTNTPYRHAGRNAYFQYQAFQRLGNLVTNRSNVYAVWITLGKFQVQQVPIGPFNPDGFALVGENGSSTGEIERKRSFYLIDRSIPVGFSRGQNLNVERTVLVERVLDQ